MEISAAAAAAAAGEAVGRRSQSGSRASVISAVWLLICLPGHKLGASPYRCGGGGELPACVCAGREAAAVLLTLVTMSHQREKRSVFGLRMHTDLNVRG